MRLTPIRFQLIAAALGVSLVVGAIFLPFARSRVERGFDAFEREHVLQERVRLAGVLQDRATRLGRTAIDYGHWDDTVEYILGTRPQWVDDNLTPDVFANFGVAAIVMTDRTLRVVAARTPEGEVPAAHADELVRGSGLCEAAMRDRTFQWRFAWLQDRPQIVACAPVMETEGNPPDVVGATVWASVIDDALVADLRELVRFPFNLHAPQPARADEYADGRIVTWLPLENADKQVGLVASLHLPRPLGLQRELTTQSMLLLLVAAVCVPSLLMLGFLEAFVARRIRRVSRWVRSMSADDHAPEPPPAPREVGFAELAVLTQEFGRTHAKAERLNRVYEVLSSTNAAIIRATDREQLFQQACSILVDTGRFAKAWIGLRDEQFPPVRIVAWAGHDDDYFEDLQRRFTANANSNAGMLPRVLAGTVPVVCNDIASDPEVVEREKLLASGSRSLALLPLVIQERTVGVISIHSSIAGFFDHLETELLRGLAGDLSFGLSHLLQGDRIDYLAKHDALTGLPNRVRFTQDVIQRLSRPAPGHVCVALLDLVRFRRINETLGRWAGDNLLTQVAGRLRGLEVSAARLGNDVFALLVDGRGSAAELVRDFEHITSRCFEQPYFLGGEEVRMGCRIGAAVFPGDGDDAESLLRNAESALRKARSAIEPFVFYEPGMNASASEAQAMESKIRRAIQREEFVLHYQPKYRLSDRRICGAEALIRWQDPESGLVPPMQFIPVLEETGLIGTVGKWALRRALADADGWRRRGGSALRVAVNVSSLQLNQQDFPAQIAELIGTDGGSALELEITESVIMDDVDRKIVMLQELRELGVQIAVDDFGTGYSSLAYISKLPITSLKIDRTFITAMADDPQSYGLVAGMIALARPLELKVVAEGVETEAQARLLRLLRCDEAQGYLFSRPVDAERFLELLLAENASA